MVCEFPLCLTENDQLLRNIFPSVSSAPSVKSVIQTRQKKPFNLSDPLPSPIQTLTKTDLQKWTNMTPKSKDAVDHRKGCIKISHAYEKPFA